MTFYYDSDDNALTENHPDEYISYDDDGRLVMDIDEMYENKLHDIVRAAEKAMENNQ